jgi:hypothetical protein
VTGAVQSRGAFPEATLVDLEGSERPLARAWRDGPALVVVGHRDCKTTRQTLPYVERIHRRAARQPVSVVLQDEPAVARALVASLELSVPVLLEAPPYALAQALQLVAVPTLFLVSAHGEIERVSEGFSRADLEAFAERLGVTPPLFLPEDRAPAMRPG